MAIKKGDKVKVDYVGTLEDGTVFDSSHHGDHSHPIKFVVGSGQVIQGFDDAVIGMEKGEEKNITIAPGQGYGEPNPELVQKFPRDKLPPEVQVGMNVMMQTKDGHQIPATIKALDETQATIDLNHPLAGKTLNFAITLSGVNEEDTEEDDHHHSHEAESVEEEPEENAEESSDDKLE